MLFVAGILASGGSAEIPLEKLAGQAQTFAEKHEWGKAQDLYRQILKRKLALYTPDDMRLIEPLNDVVRVTCIDGKCAATVPYLQQLLAIRQHHLGENNRDVATTYALLAEAYEKMGDNAKAIDCFHRAVAVRSKLYGPASDQTVAMRVNLLRLFKAKNDAANANTELELCKPFMTNGRTTLMPLRAELKQYQAWIDSRLNIHRPDQRY